MPTTVVSDERSFQKNAEERNNATHGVLASTDRRFHGRTERTSRRHPALTPAAAAAPDMMPNDPARMSVASSPAEDSDTIAWLTVTPTTPASVPGR
jgi:hypothetical protein